MLNYTENLKLLRRHFEKPDTPRGKLIVSSPRRSRLRSLAQLLRRRAYQACDRLREFGVREYENHGRKLVRRSDHDEDLIH